MSAIDLDLFRKVCGLLASDHAGERAAAAAKATAMLKAAGKTWADIGNPDAASPAQSSGYRPDFEALAGYWELMYRGERAQSEDRAKEIRRLKREVERLKGMWPAGAPPKQRAA